jgi:DNA-binding SARP family transcriptional activator
VVGEEAVRPSGASDTGWRQPGGTSSARNARLTLLGGFELSQDGRVVSLSPVSQRLIALLGLHERRLLRIFVAGVLWGDASEERASANLRSALWRLHCSGVDLVESLSGTVGLAPGVRVDFRESVNLARRLLDRTDEVSDEELRPDELEGDLLSDWYEDWVLVERERFRQLRLHALEALCECLIHAGRFGLAVETGTLAVASEPLRESANRVLIRAHLAEGNASEAVRHYRRYRDALREEVGVAPSDGMQELVTGLRI